jgi:DNA helicase-2/ATP-dependent DNA helicase PcrA
LDAVFSTDEYEWYEEGLPTRQARLDYARERLRLLYVAITRARKELVITWNGGRRGESTPAAPLVELQSFLESKIS